MLTAKGINRALLLAVFMPPLHALQYMLPLNLLVPVAYKLDRLIADSIRGSSQGLWQAPCPAGALVVPGDQGVAVGYDAAGGAVVSRHLQSLHCCIVPLKLFLHAIDRKSATWLDPLRVPDLAHPLRPNPGKREQNEGGVSHRVFGAGQTLQWVLFLQRLTA